MLKVGIIGCGQIADSHASQIKRVVGCELVGVCDREELMAKQLSQRFQVKNYFNDVAQLLESCRPDVVHITTPPQSHFGIAKLCLEQGANVYVEKPFTLCTREAEELVALANRWDLKLTAGHDAQFSHAAILMRQLIQGGCLGGRPVHMESTWCYSLSGHSYAQALLGDRQHWVRTLPGQLLQNIISHGVARIAEFLETDDPEVMVCGFVSPLLKSLGEREIVDELRVIIYDGNRATAYFTFSSQMRPALHQFRIYGPKSGLLLDEDQQSLIMFKGDKFKSYLDKFIPQILLAGQYLRNSMRNMRLFLARDFHMESSKKNLIESFYRSIRDNAPVPIPYREIILTTRIMDAIFDQVRRSNISSDHHQIPTSSPMLSESASAA